MEPIEQLSLRTLLRADFDAAIGMDQSRAPGLRRKFDVLTQPGFLALVIFRLSADAHRRGRRLLARLLLLANTVVFAAELYPQIEAGPGLIIVHPVGVAIGATTRIGKNVKICGGVHIGVAGYSDPSRDGFPTIGDDCVIFDGAKLFGPITIGEGSRIGANVLLLQSVLPGSVVVAPEGVVVGRRGVYRDEAGDGVDMPPVVSVAE